MQTTLRTMKNSVKISQYVSENLEEFLGILQDVVNRESHTYGDPAVKALCGNYLKQLFEGLGFSVETIDAGNVGFHLHGTMGNGPVKLLLVGHYDTVFPTGTTKDRPFSRKDDHAFGPGIYDMKGGLVSFYMALRSLKELDLLPRDKTIEFFFNCDEEAGSGTSKDHIIALAKEAKACLVAEPGHEGEGYVTAERFGRSVVTITAHGVAGHAGNRPEYTANPFVELSDVVEYLESRCDRERGIWYSPVSLHGGDKGPTAMTPEDAYVIYDIRYVDETLQKEAEETLRSLKPKQANVHFEISGGMEKPPFRQTEASSWLPARAKAIVEEMGHPFLPTRLGGGSDANFTAAVGCPTLCGLGLNGDFLHNPKEYVVIHTIPDRVALLAELIRTI